jgi:hypothetical protein
MIFTIRSGVCVKSEIPYNKLKEGINKLAIIKAGIIVQINSILLVCIVFVVFNKISVIIYLLYCLVMNILDNNKFGLMIIYDKEETKKSIPIKKQKTK